MDVVFHPNPSLISSATKSEPSCNSASYSSGNGYKCRWREGVRLLPTSPFFDILLLNCFFLPSLMLFCLHLSSKNIILFVLLSNAPLESRTCSVFRSSRLFWNWTLSKNYSCFFRKIVIHKYLIVTKRQCNFDLFFNPTAPNVNEVNQLLNRLLAIRESF